MNYVDFALAVSFFLFFFAAVIMFSSNYFSNLSSLTKTSEFRPISESMFNLFFKRKGVPEDWDEDYSIVPVKIGLMEDLYVVPVVVEEDMGYDRTNEPISMRIVFDEDCQNRSWNSTMRVYDENNNRINIEISNETFCTSQFLNRSNIAWEVNISANQKKKYWIYYSSDDEITDPNYISLSYNTTSWLPNDGDSWTESTMNWSDDSLGGSSVSSITTDSDKKKGNYSINIKGTAADDWLRVKYNESGTWNISEYKNIIFWFKVNNTFDNRFMIWLESGNGGYNKSFENNISAANVWYKIILPLTEFVTYGSGYSLESIDNITMGCLNDTNTVSFEFKIDNLHFEKNPLTVKTFPEEHINVVSYNKFETIKNISYEQIRKTIGENYKFRIEIDEDSYGGNINLSSNTGCHESPRIIQYRNGTIAKATTKICVWK